MHTKADNDVPSDSGIRGWTSADVRLEVHCGAPPLHPPHAHDAYQIGFTTRDPGSYASHGREVKAPPGSLVLFHPGEIHQTFGRSVRAMPARLMFIAPEEIRETARAVGGRHVDLPRFVDHVILDHCIISAFLRLHRLYASAAPDIEKQSALVAFIARMVTRFAATPYTRKTTRDQRRAQFVRDFLDAHYDDNISLKQLAQLAQISPFHLNRIFRREVGVSPHAYQIQLRIEKAKSLLIRGVSVTDVSMRTGFFDQSHFTRHFRRLIGVTPGRYALTV